MANISIKKDFVDGEKLFAQQLNNNFDTIEKGVNAGNKIIWKDDNGAEIQSFRGTTAEVAERPIIDGQTLYNIETGETALDYGDKRISTGAGNVVYIGDDEPTNDATKIWIENGQVSNLGSEIVVSVEEPTTQEKVWLQSSKNLFDVNAIMPNKYLLQQSGNYKDTENSNTSDYIPVIGGKTYIISLKYDVLKLVTEREVIYFNKDKSYRSYQAYDSKNKTITVKPDFDGYIRFDYDKNCYDIQLELGVVATPYEPYTVKKIHTKTDKGYVEFYNEEENKTKTEVIWSGHLYSLGTEHTQLFSEPLEKGKLYMFVLLGLSSSYKMTIPYIHGTGNGVQHGYYDGTTVVRWRINVNTDGTGFYLDSASLQMGVSTGVLAVYKVD